MPRPSIPQEKADEVVRLICEGLSNTKIAKLVGINKDTVSRIDKRQWSFRPKPGPKQWFPKQVGKCECGVEIVVPGVKARQKPELPELCAACAACRWRGRMR
jgi:hypothetical protein